MSDLIFKGLYQIAASTSLAAAFRSTPSQRATTAAAKQLPSMLTDVRAMSIRVSTPKISNTPSFGNPKEAAVAASTTNEARGTPATPLLVNISVSIIKTCVPNGR